MKNEMMCIIDTEFAEHSRVGSYCTVERLITFIVSESLTEKKDFLDFGEK